MATVDSALFNALRWRLIGPHRGGRVGAVAGDPVDPMTFYFGACAGGVWKTDDGGTYWRNVSDGFFNSAAVGAIAVADSDRNVVYAGMGEANIRENVYGGDGVYKSTDGGRTWAHMGLAETRHIGRIRVHPKDPDTVYVAALGHAFGPNKERGVYRSRDGGKNWEHVLFRSEDAGAVDLSIDPNNPRILFAAIYQTRRTPWSLEGGGPDSSLYRSTDGGDTWTDITRNPGMPSGTLGRLGVTVSPARSGRVWAMVEAEEGGVFRTDDGGATWQRTSDDAALRGRPWYYTHIFAHPQDPDTVWVLEGATHMSTDGGRTFSGVPVPHGDCHDLWFDPQNPRRMIHGNDGGACVSFNGGVSWSTLDNQPTAQFYHVTTDTRHPYRVYGSQQDNTSITVPSRTSTGPISIADWYSVGGGEWRVHRHPARRPGHHLRGEPLERLREPLQPSHGAGAQHHGVARAHSGLGRQGHEVPLPVDLPHPPLAARPQCPLRDGQHRLPLDRRGDELGGHQPGPHAQRREQDGAVRRAGLEGRDERGVLRHHLRLRGVAGAAGAAVGGVGRRPGPRVAGQRRDVGERDAAGTCRSGR